jgi:hypothetical protein
MGRVAIFGDVGGHADAFITELVTLGADPDTLELPADLTVIQVGDLIHRGPDSPGVLRLVDTALTRQPDQWVQLSGNHEAQYLAAPRFGWPERLNAAGEALLNQWWDDGLMRVAAAVRTGDGEQLLVTHAGLTATLWYRSGRLGTVEAVSDHVNAWIPDDPYLWRAGTMLEGITNWFAGPWWAEAGTEVYASWLEHVEDGETLPFSQVHGHSCMFAWNHGQFWSGVPARMAARAVVDQAVRHTTLPLTGGRLVGIDPGHAAAPAAAWAPLLLPDATVTAR